jgi:hypothetical protein
VSGDEKQDRVQIGLPKASFELLEELVAKTPWFAQQLDAYRLAVAVALARGWSPVQGEQRFDTKYSVSSVDKDGRLREMVIAFSPDDVDRPYDVAQRLALAGVKFLHQELVEKQRPLAEVLGLSVDETDGASE